MFRHDVRWTGVNSGTMPAPVSVVPVYRIQENVVKTKGGARRRNRHGIWAGCKIIWTLEPSELASLDNLLAAENGANFTLSLDGGVTYRGAALSNDPDPKSLGGVNVAVEIALEFEFTTRLSAVASPVHLGATS